jgi:hypothetical protein
MAMEMLVLLLVVVLSGTTWGLYRLCDRLRGQS